MSQRSILRCEELDAILANEALPRIVDRLSVNDSRNGGRPRHQSVFALVFVHIAVRKTLEGRARHGIAELANQWDELGEKVKALYPDRPDFWFTGRPLGRGHYYDFRKPYLDTEDGVQVMREALEETAIPLADELGLCREDGLGSRTHPHPSRTVHSDGTVIRSASRYKRETPVVDEETGEILRYRRCDPDAAFHSEGGSEQMQRGHKVVLMSTRGEGWYQRVILSVDSVGAGGEMATLEPMADRILPRLPGALAVLYDAAARGKTREHLLREHGVELIAPPAAKKAARSRKEVREEKEAFLETVVGTYPDGTTTPIELWVHGGQVHTVEFDEAANRLRNPLTLHELHRRGHRGRYRVYGDYTTDDGARLRLRGLPTDEDRQRKFNRCENFRFFPRGSPQYAANYPRRADAEAANRQLKDALWQRRAGSYGKTRVLIDALGWAIGANAVAAHLHRNRQVPTATAA